MKKSSIAIIILLFLLVVLVATYMLMWRSETPSVESFVEVTDALGRTVRVHLPIKRVIITGSGSWPIVTVAYMFPNAKSLLYGLGKEVNVPLLRLVDPNLESKLVQITGGISNIEDITAAEPDVVILKTTMKSNMGDSLEQLGLKVVYVDFENLDSYMRDILVLGKIFGDEAKAKKIAEYYNETCSSLLSITYALNERPRVLLLYYSTKGGTVSFNTPGAGWLQTFMIETAGGNPLSKELTGTGWNTISVEQIAKWNPDVIFLVTYSDAPSATDVKNMLLQDPDWKKINAIAQNRVYAVPHDCNNVAALGSWDVPGSRWILGLKWMATKIQPSIFSNIDIIEEAKTFYMEMYSLSEEDAAMVVDGIKGDLE